MTRKPLLRHTHIVKFGRILDMLYKPSEIGDEIGITADTICRSYIPAGLPYTRDNRNRIWIHGPAFVAWAKETVAKKKAKRAGLPDGFAWCLKCKQIVPLQNPTVQSINRYLEFLQGKCPACQTKINRAQARQTPSPKDGGKS